MQEIREETGIIDLEEPKPILVHSKFYEDKQFYRLFIGYISQLKTDQVVLSPEHDELKWVNAN